MMIQRGMRDKLDKYLNSSKDFEVEMIVSGIKWCHKLSKGHR